jgi:hypothetical protein
MSILSQQSIDDIMCNSVYTKETENGHAVFANHDIKKGELIERGLARIVPLDGNDCPYCFTWSEDRTKWALCSGYATFYNTSKTANTVMNRDFEKYTFEIYAKTDISKHTELTHTYRSLGWRKCFSELNKTL